MKVGDRVRARSEDYPDGFLRKGEAVVIEGPGRSALRALRGYRHWRVRFVDGRVGFYPEHFLEEVLSS